jgi:hypothetical protein
MHEQISTFARSLCKACAHLAFLTFVACAGVAKPEPDADKTISSVSVARVTSAKTGAIYPLYIYLPPSYASAAATYPVIYATDGDASFPPDGRFMNLAKILQRRRIEAVLVGIGGTRRRSKDFVLPGAGPYHEFITQELVPYIESRIRADPKRRILCGLSLGGEFVVTALFLEAPDALYFSHFISAEGSFFLHSFLAQEKQFSESIGSRSIPATLILARGYVIGKAQQQPFSTGVGTRDMATVVNLANVYSEATISAAVHALYERMTNRHYVDLRLIETKFATDHGGTDRPSFEDAMDRIFN